jgi:hypothetical protein
LEELSWLEESERRIKKCDGRVESVANNGNEKWKEWELANLSMWMPNTMRKKGVL